MYQDDIQYNGQRVLEILSRNGSVKNPFVSVIVPRGVPSQYALTPTSGCSFPFSSFSSTKPFSISWVNAEDSTKTRKTKNS